MSWYGKISYLEGLNLQENFDESLVLFHTDPLFTVGRRGSQQMLPHNIPSLEVDRGGSVTYHGPSQVIIFPSWSSSYLEKKFGDTRPVKEITNWFLDLSQAALSVFGIPFEIREDNPGLYYENLKIASIGFKITVHGIRHGMAINVQKDAFPLLVNPCDLQAVRYGSLGDVVEQTVGVEQIAILVLEAYESFKI